MTHYLRLLSEPDKAVCLVDVCRRLREGKSDARSFTLLPNAFDAIPGKPFAYWITESERKAFSKFQALSSGPIWLEHGGSTKDDFRFLRSWWEVSDVGKGWYPLAKGGPFALFVGELSLVVNWANDARELEAALLKKYPYLGNNANWVLHRESHYGREGFTWTHRTTKKISVRILPRQAYFGGKGPAGFIRGESHLLGPVICLMNSSPFQSLLELFVAAGDAAARSYDIGIVSAVPFPCIDDTARNQLARLFARATELRKTQQSVDETSHSFLLPATLRQLYGEYDHFAINEELAEIQVKIDSIAYDLYDFSETDRLPVLVQNGSQQAIDDETATESDSDDNTDLDVPPIDGLLSWAVGVAFGRFDGKLATDKRRAPSDSDPFDSLPDKSPGMLPDDADPFQVDSGILVDEQGHSIDLTRLVEEVLAHLDIMVQEDIRRWIRRDFFPFHLQRYSKSRRKAPIYWPLSTTSGNYTLWTYYPMLNGQTLYNAINNFIEPKLKNVSADITTLHNKGAARSQDDEKQLEILQTFDLELLELRDTLLKIAPAYKPNHDDGVQISAAPLWPLFQYKPWQNVLKETWTKLQKGDYDWAHLAMNYWPERVREKCKTDKSLAIAHGLEELYVEPKAKPKKSRAKAKAGGTE